MLHKLIYYLDKEFKYQHVTLPKDTAKLVPKTHLMSESEWKNLGIQQSQGWIHYMMHEPEPHILLFQCPRHKKPKKRSWQATFQPKALNSCPYFLTTF
ncbi:cyclin-dependent kinases regulatory subunit 1-like [Otolemur garnettii]|uniref:cyclin-dependent kinases regulatory subunit 1-like n=1 Tax=Otolemur garnettii TaxID=30611 RepID=UPI000C7EF74F|nr:cyclin-dependent kinases regulatory subunit 1-like [Otolemur garnettii]